MPVDTLNILQVPVTKTATFNGAALILGGGSSLAQPMFARVIYSAAGNASGANAVTFSVDVCYDGVPTLWFVDFVAPPINLSTTIQQGELFIPFFVKPTVVSGVITAPQIRLTATFSGAGSTPTITYQGDLDLSRP